MSFELPTTHEKADYVLRQFDRIARGYDLTNDVISLGMHRLWKKKAVDSLKLKPSGRYLDVCCGTGDLLIMIGERLSADGRVVGVDFSAQMLAVAGRRLGRAQRERKIVSKLDLLNADAQALPFADDSFDGAIVSFGLRNLTNLEQGIKEMRRVVKPGSFIVNLDLGHPHLPWFAPIYLAYFNHLVPIIGQILQGDRHAYTYLPKSLLTYPDYKGISCLFTNCGLVDVAYESLALGTVALHVGTKG